MLNSLRLRRASFLMIALVIFPRVRCFLLHPGYQSSSIVQLPSISHKFSIKLQKDDDDDGWGDAQVSTEIIESLSSFDDRERISKSKELERLQSDLSAKRTKDSMNNSGATRNDSGDRDLFIPIFTLVSVIGFTGLYGYEMLRLYSRGELYIPWEQ